MLRTTLDPKLDIVFKLLFGEERNRALLVSFLHAVLRPAARIAAVEVLPAEPTKEAVDDKGIVLDLRVELASGEQVDIEMQSRSRPALRERALYYWARMSRNDERELVLWGSFLSARTDKDLEALAMTDPVLKEAKEALDRLSADPKARRMAEQREMAEISYNLYMTMGREQALAEGMAAGRTEGLAAGRAEGMAEGMAAGLAAAVLEVFETRHLPLTQEQRRRIEACSDLPTLKQWVRRGATVHTAEELFA